MGVPLLWGGLLGLQQCLEKAVHIKRLPRECQHQRFSPHRTSHCNKMINFIHFTRQSFLMFWLIAVYKDGWHDSVPRSEAGRCWSNRGGWIWVINPAPSMCADLTWAKNKCFPKMVSVTLASFLSHWCMFKCPFSDNVGLHLLFDPFKDGSAWFNFC